ncbi:putative deoxyribonuclease tatdn3 [Apophysomyces ossiformis]|uniref:Putative deoxyribonuclease tatdn3 n=1 Tax=Apophysomyces ossiformis TaxID=679940 RepID=A0A8H7BJK0_9FUNG|nr:putative deoxyribonuclease tatdn3 [Apophysomyces ossiformis]
MIDVHAHINSHNFPPAGDTKTLDLIISAAKNAGVQHVVSVSESIHDAPDIIQVARNSNGFIWPAVGLHPVQPLSKEDKRERSVTIQDLELFEPFLNEAISTKEIYCVGEVGLDFSPHIISKNQNNSSEFSEEQLKDIQREVFRRQVLMAMQADLPVNGVVREESGRSRVLVQIVEEVACLHCMNRYYFSVPPSIVRSPQKQTLVKNIDLTHLLLETDSPALGPERGVDNEPANILIAAEEIARIKKVTVEEVVCTI